MAGYRDLDAWQEAMRLVTEVYRESATFPSEERYGLAAQLKRASVSVPSNIAEGHARGTTAEFRRFLAIARGSLAEVETQIEIALRIELLSHSPAEGLLARCDKLGRILYGLQKSLQPSTHDQ